MITLETFYKRRQTLINYMTANSAALFFAAPTVTRSNNSEYPYRQNSNFWYFTGFNEPQSLFLLIKNDKNDYYSVLFNRIRDLTSEIWLGRRLGQDAALEKHGVDRAFPWHEVNAQLYKLLQGLDVVYHALGENIEGDKLVLSILEKLRYSVNQNLRAPSTITDWRPWVHEMRLFKSEEEINILRNIGNINALAHTRAMKNCHPGMFEYQLEGEVHYEFYRHGAHFTSYNTIVGSGKNSCILHYTENDCKMNDGDLVLIDASCELHGYAGDVTRTFPVNGKFNKPQRDLYHIVLSSLYKALSIFRPGISIFEVNNEVVHTMIIGLVQLGVLKGNLNTLLEEQAYRPFFMHSLSHWLGLDVHDVGNYGTLNRDRILEPGMVLTVEPGLYIIPDDKVPVEYHNIGIRIEDTIVITLQGNEILTDNVVKDPNHIEMLMGVSNTK